MYKSVLKFMIWRVGMVTISILAFVFATGYALYFFREEKKHKQFLKLLQEESDMFDKLMELLKNNASDQELREFLPIFRSTDERIKKHCPQLQKLAHLEKLLLSALRERHDLRG